MGISCEWRVSWPLCLDPGSYLQLQGHIAIDNFLFACTPEYNESLFLMIIVVDVIDWIFLRCICSIFEFDISFQQGYLQDQSLMQVPQLLAQVLVPQHHRLTAIILMMRLSLRPLHSVRRRKSISLQTSHRT